MGDANIGVTRNGMLGGAINSNSMNNSNGIKNGKGVKGHRNVMTSVAKSRNGYNGPRQKPELRESEANCFSTVNGAIQQRGKLQSQIS